MSRAAVFLEEMGVGPLWRRRDGEAHVAAGPAAAGSAREASEASAQPLRSAQQALAQPEQVTLSAQPTTAAQAQVAMPAPPAPAGKASPHAPAPAAAPPRAQPDAESTAWFDDAPPPPPVAPVSDQAIAAMDWDELRAAVARCTRCELCQGRKGVVFGRGAAQADWLIVGPGPARADEREGRPFSGEAGILLDNMLRAIGVDAGLDVYISNLVKCRPGAGAEAGAYAPTPQQAAACRPYLERELALTGSRTIITLGQAAAAGLLGPQAASRGAARELGGATVVATYHPGDLLLQGENKAKAWADLCLARSTHGAAK